MSKQTTAPMTLHSDEVRLEMRILNYEFPGSANEVGPYDADWLLVEWKVIALRQMRTLEGEELMKTRCVSSCPSEDFSLSFADPALEIREVFGLANWFESLADQAPAGKGNIIGLHEEGESGDPLIGAVVFTEPTLIFACYGGCEGGKVRLVVTMDHYGFQLLRPNENARIHNAPPIFEGGGPLGPVNVSIEIAPPELRRAANELRAQLEHFPQRHAMGWPDPE